MSQLTKGGKYGLSWSTVGNDGRIVIPPEAYTEYRFNDVQHGILLSGSKTSGGFMLGTRPALQQTIFAGLFEQYPALAEFQIPEGEPVEYQRRTSR
jgi:hypothetical protein